MKKGIIISLFLLLLAGFAFSSESAQAAKKLKTKEYSLYVQQGKPYKLSKILSDIWDRESDGPLKDCLKGKKVKWSAKKKQIKLGKKHIKVKKSGMCRLVGKTKKCKYIIVFFPVPEKWEKVPDGIVGIDIMRYGRWVEVKDGGTVETICRLLNSADYCFNYERTNRTGIGCNYRLTLYYADGKIERHISLSGDVLDDEYSYKRKGVQNPYPYIDNLYQTMLPTVVPQ